MSKELKVRGMENHELVLEANYTDYCPKNIIMALPGLVRDYGMGAKHTPFAQTFCLETYLDSSFRA
jgi:hypothetical protein